MRRSFLLPALLALNAAPALPACLLGDYSVPAELKRSFAVVIGKPVSERIIPDLEDPPGFAATTYRIVVIKPLIGTKGSAIEVRSENDSGRFPMSIGTEYLLFLYEADGYLRMDSCGNSGPVAERKNIIANIGK